VWQKLILIAVLGGIGTLARYILSGFVQRLYGGNFPWGTAVVNITGCFLFGLVWSIAEHRIGINNMTRTVLLVGFMGSFTTFSTYMFETGELLRGEQWLLALANLLAQNIIGIGFLFIGFAIGRIL